MARFTHKKKIAFVAAAMVVVTSGAAFAYWTQGGAGTGQATTGTTTAVVVKQTNAAVTGLFPSGPAQPLSGTFDNPSAAAVTVGAVTATVSATSVAGCLPAWYSITGTSTPATQVLPSGNGVGAWSGLSVSMLNDAANQDICKNASITISYTVPAGA